MIHWFIFNFMVLIVSLALIFNARNDFTTAIATILLVVTIILIIKDMFTVRS